MRTDCDLLIVGGGLAGLSLAARLADPAFAGHRIVLLEPRGYYRRDRTWSYWRLHGHPFESAVARRWDRWRVGGTVRGSAAVPYHSIPADRFYDAALARVAAAPWIEVRRGTAALALGDLGEVAVAQTTVGTLLAAHAFDGRPPARPPGALRQRFLGQEVRTARPAFDPGVVTLMDFLPGGGAGTPPGVHFMYVLPWSSTEALVEDTWFVAGEAPLPDHRDAVAAYLRERHGASGFDVLREESGDIPLHAVPDPAAGPRVFAMGTAGGAVKPSSGYAFLAVQRWADRVAADLAAGRPPRAVPHRGALSAWMDAVFLERLRRHPRGAAEVFERLFARCPPEALARFLGDVPRPADVLRVALALPKAPMLATALLHVPPWRVPA